LLIEELLVGLSGRHAELYTTGYWYFRACRAAVLGAGGHLSGPFEQLEREQQEHAIRGLLELRDDILLADTRAIVPAMVDVASRHPRLNLLNLEVAATGLVLAATIWLSPPSAEGILPDVLDAENVTWRTVALSD
jgi:hypothetical protein